MTETQFIRSVQNVFPNPPFTVNVETDKEKISYTQNDFKNLDAAELKDYSWKEEENIREVRLTINEGGFYGNVVVAILEKDNAPVKIINKLSKEVIIDEETFELNMEIRLGVNEIDKSSSTIDVDDEGNIKSSSHYSTLTKSKSRFSLHGINYAGSLFPEYYNSEKKSMLKWPLPMLIILDVQGTNGLDLNSARNEIIYNDKWNHFEETVSFLICKGFKQVLEPAYWEQLVIILRKKSNSENFLSGLNHVIKNEING
jgi:molecular chaperone HtpG